MFDPTSALLGGAAAWILKPGNGSKAITAQLLEKLSADKPSVYDVLTYDALEARDNKEITVAGDFINVVHYPTTVPFYIRLNEKDNPAIDLNRLKTIRYPFYRFFLTNIAGAGTIILKVGRGLQLEEESYGIDELAARMASPVTFDRRGEVIWIENFENSTNKLVTVTTAPHASTFAISTTTARNGASSGLLSIAVGETLTVRKTLGLTHLSKVGLEISFTLSDSINNITASIYVNDGSYLHWASIRYLESDSKLYYYNSAGGFTELYETLDLAIATQTFHTLKFVVDLTTHKYVRMMLDNIAVDMSTLAYYYAASVSSPSAAFQLAVENNAIGTQYIYLDDMIVTQNEP